MQLLLIADKNDETSRRIVGFFNGSEYKVIEANSVDVVLRNVLKKEADVQSGKARGKNTRVRAVSSHRKRMREPPMVGVPAFEKCVSGPSSRTDCPTLLRCILWMNHGDRAKQMNMAVSMPMITLKGTYLSTFSQLSQSASSLKGYSSS